ncbi:MAG: general secretion pathway protein GspK [Deltaproteobacteria bacterium]|nr:general secretion pathway protein GspK [Deltaproteobacteria bacterium]
MTGKLTRRKKNESGIALFMVISSLALLSVVIAELTYTTQINARMAYNNVDNLKAFYLAKAGFKLSLLRLRAFAQASKFANDPANKQVKQALGKDILDKLWNFPFIYPIPALPDATEADKDALKAFQKESKLTGSFTANITSESGKLNLNNLLIKEIPKAPAGQTQSQQGDKSSRDSGGSQPGSSPGSSGSAQGGDQVDFRPLMEDAISNALQRKKDEDHEFFDTYRSVQGKDIVDAIDCYLSKEPAGSNLPGFKRPDPKEAPLYSMSELHLINGLDDNLYDVIEPLFTVYSTPGINVNSAGKTMFKALFPDASDEDIDGILRKRDDPDVGKPWESEEEFWKSVSDVAAGKNIEQLKERLKKANVKIVTDELSFKVSVVATHGLSTKRLEAYVILDAPEKKKPGTAGTGATQGSGGQTQQGQQSQTASDSSGAQQDSASAKKPTGLNLIYWRII